jgi:hypothetical protein
MEKARREQNMKIIYKMVNTTKQFNPRTSVCKDKEGKMIANKEASSEDGEITLMYFCVRK